MNINTPDYWDAVYSSEIQMGTVRALPTIYEQVLKNAMPSKMGGIALDYAGGTGEFARYLLDHRPDWSADLYERSDVARDYAERVHRPHCATLRLLAGPPEPYPAYAFVFCGSKLQHFPDPVQTARYLMSLVIPSGRLALAVPFGSYHSDPENYWEFDQEALATLLPRLLGTLTVDRYILAWYGGANA